VKHGHNRLACCAWWWLQVPGVHDPLDPEYSILKQRLARRARYEKLDVSKLDLVSITKLANRWGGLDPAWRECAVGQ
jgi:hypothetical protein